MKKKLKIIILILAITTWGIWFTIPSDINEFFTLEGRRGGSSGESSFTYVTEGQNQIVYSGSVTLDRIVIGNDVTAGSLAIFNSSSANPGKSDMVIYIDNFNTPMMGSSDVFLGVELSNGILVNVTESTSRILNATIFYSKN